MKEIVDKFYQAFANKDADKMIECYHEDLVFEDPAFGQLNSSEAKAMWQMLCENLKDRPWDLFYKFKNGDQSTASAHWEAKYLFSQTGRKVHNKITAKFQFKDGKIIKHHDDFNLHRWASQAMGFKGWLLGGTGFFKRKLNHQCKYLLKKYMKSREDLI